MKPKEQENPYQKCVERIERMIEALERESSEGRLLEHKGMISKEDYQVLIGSMFEMLS